MKKIDAIIFGANEYALQIVKQIQGSYNSVNLYVLEDEFEKVDKDIADSVDTFDLSDDWDDFSERFDVDHALVFCALEQDSHNIFLTISLRAEFDNLRMIALSRNSESANKLKMAGASKVIPMIQTTSNMILDILEKPVVTDMLHKVLYEEGDVKIAEVSIGDNSDLIGLKIGDIQFQERYKILVIAYVNDDFETHFIFSSDNKNHLLQASDVLVAIGYEEDINNFTQKMGGTNETNWRHWSW
ncbi:MAG TPA: TrkA family potassium uptake protein [Helicobacteraceae bacterium]|nr:TrkA family potassium uptake protein [Helicobacteraceae bacterium]